MDWVRANAFFLTLFALYTLVLARNAWAGKKETASATDYYVGGRHMGGFVLGMSFFATFASTNAFVGHAGKAYEYGAPWLLMGVLFVIFCLVSWRWIAPRFREMTAALDSVTIADFVGARYASPAGRTLVALVLIVASVLYMTAIYKGMGNLLQVFLGLPYATSILVVFLITMAYTAVGGFRSVVRTDVVQGSMMLVAAVCLAWGVLSAVGGPAVLGRLAARPESAHLFTLDAGLPFALLLGIMVAGASKLLVEPRQLSRFYALRDAEAIRLGRSTAVAGIILLFALLLPIGLYARALPLGVIEDTDLVVPTLLAGELFDPRIAAFISLAIVAAAMSSLDSVLLVVASVCQRDLAGRLFPATERRAIAATRVYVVLAALATALVALEPPGGIVEITALSGSLYAVCLAPVVLMGLHWRRGNGASLVLAAALGIGTLVLWGASPWAGALHEVFPATAISLAAYAIHARLASPVATQAVQSLFHPGRMR